MLELEARVWPDLRFTQRIQRLNVLSKSAGRPSSGSGQLVSIPSFLHNHSPAQSSLGGVPMPVNPQVSSKAEAGVPLVSFDSGLGLAVQRMGASA